MSKPQQVKEQPVDGAKADFVGTGQKGQEVMSRGELEGSERQEALDDTDDDDYTTYDWKKGSKGRLRGYRFARSKPTSTRHSLGASVQSASIDKGASVETAGDGASQTVTTDIDPSRSVSQP